MCAHAGIYTAVSPIVNTTEDGRRGGEDGKIGGEGGSVALLLSERRKAL